MQNIFERIREFLTRRFSYIEQQRNITINRTFTFRENAEKNALWYDGDANELQQFYQKIGNPMNSFWGSRETPGQEIKRCHVGLPALIIDNLVNITANSLDSIDFEEEEDEEQFEKMDEDDVFQDVISKLTRAALVVGDGAVKFTFDLKRSAYPIMEVVPGQRVDFIKQQGMLKEVRFYSYFSHKMVDYTLEEVYGYGYIQYHLYADGKERSLSLTPETEGLEDLEFDDDVLMAVPFRFFESERYEGRGKSIYENKIDAFDNIDECISQWMDALRAVRTKTYIPMNLIPRDAQGGYLLRPNSFDCRFIKIGADTSENAKNQVTTEQPTMQTDNYLQTYITQLDIALQGIISPSTLGIDVKKLDNAEAQREKEKCTLYTRDAILNPLGKIIVRLVKTYFRIYETIYDLPHKEIELTANFGEYANPSFEAVVEVMSNPNTPMSIEARVEELWGNSKTDEWKEEEIARIKMERGMVGLDEPALNMLYGGEGLDDTNL